jgi:hypothetical protein
VRDVKTYAAMIERLQAGEPYYEAVGAELRKGNYATWPLVNWRTPLHFSMVAYLGVRPSGTLLTIVALTAVALATLAGLRESISRGIAFLLFVMGAMLPALMSRPGGVVLPEVWAGALIGASLGCYENRWWRAGAYVGVLAVFIRELAAPYGLLCGMLALRVRRMQEWRIWVVGGSLYVVYYGFHVWQASTHVQPGDVVNAQSWVQFLGLPFLLHTLNRYGWLLLLPPACTAIALGLAMLAWAAPSMPSQLRAASVAYAALFLIVGQPFDVYWGLLTAPIWGLTFVHARTGTARLVTDMWGTRSHGSSARMSVAP